LKSPEKIALIVILFFFSAAIKGQKGEIRTVNTHGFSTFVPNVGQWSDSFKAMSVLGYGNVYCNNNGYRMLFWDNVVYGQMMEEFHLQKNIGKDYVVNFASLQFSFVGANETKIAFQESTNWLNHYYIGNDKELWKSNVQPYYQYIRRNVYDGIHFQHSTLGDYLKTEWHVQPNAQTDNIKISINGADSIAIINEDLIIYTPVGNLIEKAPVAWQTVHGEKQFIETHFHLEKNILSFQVSGYNKAFPLIIDPLLIFSTYSGSTSDNFGFTATYDSKGSLYAGGISGNQGGKYPTTVGAFQDTFKGGQNTAPANLACDMTISKYSPDGKQLLYATYLGGDSNDFPHSLVVNSKDELYILGTTYSNNFPINKGYDGSYNGDGDIVIIHFNENCSQLMQSTYIGGANNDGLNAPVAAGTTGFNYADDFRGDIVIDSNGNVYVATCSESIDFPVSATASQKINAGKRDAVIFSLDSTLKKLRFSTYWGGINDDAAYSVKINSHGLIYVGGGTTSANFPTTTGAYRSVYQGGRADGFVCALDSSKGIIMQSSLYGTSSYDQVYFIDIDLDNRIYLAGQTEGKINRSTNTHGKDNTSQFIACLDSALTNLVFQTTFGNRLQNPELSPTAFLVDNCYNIYFSGWGSNVGVGHRGTTAGLETKNPNWPSTDGNDFYLYVMNKEARGLIYASFIGGTQSADHVDGGTSRFDKNGIVYQSVCASCPPSGTSMLSDFPTTLTSFSPTNPSVRCSNASFKLDFQISYYSEALFTAPSQICKNDMVIFTNTGKGTSFQWSFGDGATDTARNPSHQYEQQGTYTVRLIAIDSLACNIADTAYKNLTILDAPKAGFEVTYEPCNPGLITFNPDPAPGANMLWKLGDGKIFLGELSEYRYAKDGSYTVTQTVTYPNGCKDSFQKNIILSSTAGGALQLFNVFTPNNDNLNTCWKPEGLNITCEDLETWIYNRHGVCVFNSKEDNFCWNGRINNTGAFVTEGTYYYAITVKRKDRDEEKKVFGVITVLR